MTIEIGQDGHDKEAGKPNKVAMEGYKEEELMKQVPQSCLEALVRLYWGGRTKKGRDQAG